MARRPIDLAHAHVAQVLLAAMRRLKNRGDVLVGPVQIGREAAIEYGKPVPSTLSSLYLRRLVEAGLIERVPQGPRRGHYRLLEEF